MPKKAGRGQKYTKRVNRDGSQQTGRVSCLVWALAFAGGAAAALTEVVRWAT